MVAQVLALLLTTLNGAVSGSNPKIESRTRVGPTVAKDIRNSAIYSVVFSLLIIFLYILIRFRRYQYSLGAIAALFHDVTIVLGIFSLFGSLELLVLLLPLLRGAPCVLVAWPRLSLCSRLRTRQRRNHSQLNRYHTKKQAISKAKTGKANR